MKKLTYLMMIAFMAFSLYSCEDPLPPEVEAKITFPEGQKLAFSMSSDEDTETINFESTKTWTVSVDEAATPWCSISPEKGDAGDANTITISSVANETTEDRVATIIIQSDKVQKKITVTQGSKDPDELVVSPKEISVIAAGEEFEVKVSSNVDIGFAIDAAATWITEVTTKTLEETVLKFKAEANPQTESRIGKITITTGNKSETVTVTQDPFEVPVDAITFPLWQPSVTIYSTGTTLPIEFESTVEWTVSVKETEAKTWCSVSPEKGGAGANVITVVVTANETTEDRVATIIIGEEEIQLTQLGTTVEIVVSKSIKLGTLLISDRNLGDQVPQGGDALNYTNYAPQPDHQNSAFMGDYYTWEDAQTACPDGWRLPTALEVENIIAPAIKISEGRAYLEDGEGNRCYFPLSGFDLASKNSWAGHYWTRDESVDVSGDCLGIIAETNKAFLTSANRTYGFSVRCIKGDDDVPEPENIISVPVKLGTLLISDRNLGDQVPQGGDASNYSHDVNHPDHQNKVFKGDYYTWEEALIACPVNWRLPTKEECESISDALTFFRGRVYLEDDDNNRCYFPKSSLREESSTLNISTYWSSTERTTEVGWGLDLYDFLKEIGGTPKTYGCSVRCVQDDNDVPEPDVISVPITLGTLLISDRNSGDLVPQGGDALNYNSDANHIDNKNVDFKGDYYTWEEAKNACPVDWRLPTKDELSNIIIPAMTLAEGRFYLTDAEGKKCYLPVSGIEGGGMFGGYWSSDERAENTGWGLDMYEESYEAGSSLKTAGLSVRCVQTVQ